MTCKDCFKFSDCLEWESTKYYGLDACCNNVESLCEDFKNKADFVEAVRCRNCKRCFEKRTKRNKQLMRFCMRMDGNEYQVNANDFCSYGERKNEDSN